MKLRSGLPKTQFQPPRGLGEQSIPLTGANSLQSATFQTLDEVRSAQSLAYKSGHIFLGRVDDRMIGHLDNRHIMTVAGSRAGKSVCLLTPNLLMYPGSALVIDPKGELARDTARHRAEALGQHVVVLDPFEFVTGEAAAYRGWHDPLRELDETGPDFIDDAATLPEAMVLESAGVEDGKHWTTAARNLLTALTLSARLSGETLAGLRTALTGDPASLWHILAGIAEVPDAPEVVQAAVEIIRSTGHSFLHKNDREAPAIVSTAAEQISFLRSPAMRNLFEPRSDRPEARLSSLKTGHDGKPVTIYLVLPAGRMGTHNRWLRLLVTMALVHFERLKNVPEHPILMVLEEFAALGHLRPVEQAAGFIAGSHVRLWSVLQDLSQLKTHYKDGWETFLGNAGVIQAFSVSDLTTCEYLSKRLGEVTVEVTNRHSVGSNEMRAGDTGERREFRTAPLMTPSEIAIEFARLIDGNGKPAGLTLVLVPGVVPFIVDRVFWEYLQP